MMSFEELLPMIQHKETLSVSSHFACISKLSKVAQTIGT